MLLRDIALFLNVDEYEREYRSEFGFRSRYVCNYLSRRLQGLRFKADGFQKLCVEGRHEAEEGCPIVGANAVVASISFDQAAYEALRPGEQHEFFIGMLLEGIETCARYKEIPLDELVSSIEEFRRDGYRNVWLFKKKRLTDAKLSASLICSMDTERFELTLKLARNDDVVFDAPILETKPDETIFAYRFKDVVLENNAVVVINKFGKPTFSVPLDALA